MNITALYNEYREKLDEQDKNINEFVAAGFLYIVGHYLRPLSNYFVLTLSCRREHTCHFYNHLISKLFITWDDWPHQIVNIQSDQGRRIDGNRRYNMIFVDSYESFLEAKLVSYTGRNDYNEYYYIFLQNRDILLPQDMKNIFEYCWRNYLINCVVQIQTAKGELLLYTYYPYTAQYCGKVEIVLINQFNGTSLLRNEIFPKKLNNLHGCPLRTALWNVPPYMELTTDPRNKSHITGGFEGMILLALSRKLNFTLDIKVPVDVKNMGTVLDNGTMTGALAMLNDRVVDLGMGLLRQSKQRSTIATSTVSYHQSSYALVTLEDIYQLSSLEWLILPFTPITWILHLIVCFLALLIGVFLKYYNRKAMPNMSKGSMDMILMLLGLPAIYMARNDGTRIWNACWMIYTLIIRSMYQGFLFHMIRNQITKRSPKTLEELIEQGFSIMTNEVAGDALKDFADSQGISLQALNHTSQFAILEILEKLPLNDAKNLVAALPIDFLQYYKHVHRKSRVFRTLPYRAISMQICIYLPKHSYLVDQLDHMLLWIRDCGLFNFWSRQHLDNLNFNKQLQEDNYIGLTELNIVFLIVIVCYVIAIMVFIAELLYKKLESDRVINK